MTFRLELESIAVSRGGKTVLQDVTLSVREGEIVALLGANGAGKSSLVLAAAGALPLDQGRIRAGGRDVTDAAPHAVRTAGIAAVPEGHRVLTGLSVQENLEAAGAFLSSQRMREGVESAYATFPELADRRRQQAGSMSGGQQQMLALGQALVGNPKVIIADEMSLGLAPLIVHRLLEVAKTLAAAGTGILLIEQFTHLALAVSDRATVLDRGRVVFSGSAQELSDRPQVLHEAYLAGRA